MTGPGAFFGELYYRSTLPFLAPETTAAEVAYLARAFSGGQGPLLDLGCGHGRHAGPLAAQVRRPVLGVDLDALSLADAAGFQRVRGDLLALPLKDGAIADGYAWYSTLFALPREDHPRFLAEARRVLRDDGLLVVHTLPIERLREAPAAHYRGTLPDGSVLHEDSRFDAATGTDHGFRRLTTADGRVLSAGYAIHYYPLESLLQLFETSGFRVQWVHGALDGSPVASASRDLILGAKKRHA